MASNFKYNLLEKYRDNLADYVRSLRPNEYPSVEHFDVLWRSCTSVTLALAKLHEQTPAVYLAGKLDPSKVLIQPKCGLETVRLVLPDDETSCNHEDTFLTVKWETGSLNDKERDFISLAPLLFFIWTHGKIIEIPPNPNSETIDRFLEAFDLELEQSLCMEYHDPIISDYRRWRRVLLSDLLEWIFQYFQKLNASQILRHPFFWHSDRILSFIMNCANHLKEGESDLKKKFYDRPKLPKGTLSKLKRDFPKNFSYLKTTASAKKSRGIEDEIQILTAIRDKYAHWSEKTNGEFQKEAIEELKDVTFSNENESDQDKFCLFWMSMFPDLLKVTWKTLMGDNTFVLRFPEFFPCID